MLRLLLTRNYVLLLFSLPFHENSGSTRLPVPIISDVRQRQEVAVLAIACSQPQPIRSLNLSTSMRSGEYLSSNFADMANSIRLTRTWKRTASQRSG